MRRLTLFGSLSSSPLAPWVRPLPNDDPELLETSVDLAREAIERTRELLARAEAFLGGELDREGLRAAIPERSMADGSPIDGAPVGRG